MFSWCEPEGLRTPLRTYFFSLYHAGKQKGKQHCSDAWTGPMSEERWKRRRVSVDGCAETNMEEQLIKVLERNSKRLNAQLEAQNVNSQLDRDQRKDHANSLVAALSKLTDAIVRIADKL
ncbi:Trihelix transcription factor ASR3 [Vitis vinifera]|uniref:Trihelix transcription factor ASR3 n=1 Tax=Vitis vinifera TaxID=29760 RepID=A0A438K9Y5_VITVI|nr:Trihelix transcription factor ASR3 [Vitis vinifera]